MDDNLDTIGGTLARAEERMRSGRHAAERLWPTGFSDLDAIIGGGLRSGGLALLAGPHGLGKTTFAVQICRNVVRTGRPVLYFSYEHEADDISQKLLAMEAGELDATGRSRLTTIREAFEGDDVGSIEQRLDAIPSAVQALSNVRAYAELMFVHRSTGSRTDLAAIRAHIDRVRALTGSVPLVVVDYLQKVLVPGGPADENERSTTVVEGLKDLAIDIAAPVLAIVAAEKEALQSGTRMRMHHLRGSSALAYEADVVLVLNNKVDIVARHHLMYDLGNTERFREWAILGIEKNRFGRDGIELEYKKRFDQGRFEPEGRTVTEQLIDDRVFLE
ncbi:DnaB-like helicase C-terminal domain-containing protein [Nocardioides allogilvus]|uniref:DnaB-like helicase C-terminal domain-containing protein n=1 Tax=Nocardioides allogilvus TaxID=2072017 RepID=UPI0018E53487|nr:DnaB-like helicase C-terminal domain-containing protein [Nocardioides allogilvus]